MAAPSPEVVAALQRQFSGLNDQLNYLEGSTIYKKNKAYKEAHEVVKSANTNYNTTAKELMQKKPYNPDDPAYGKGLKGGQMFTKSGHRVLGPLAGTVIVASQFHVDRRTSFNTTYQAVLEGKVPEEYTGHVKQVKDAQKSTENFGRWK
ncbi:hypothetical protein GLAREA_12162 [Glarea lozoyensis ATCC 20868]|uniref:Uncharacterized protein n=1 Tax=Glarea lozoyensis (strain ATCC 20868 / MF5171) TaxID=1116229 RepID=S3D2M3_GLAL2|nr:uncharacterized protein GLAREA_12162 [Glarea lozoyensis ATCC 20868]EPE32080.1 hypothetical protein GLAREA_12162 [Glarea lozoyensis ATCC 20868]